MDKTDEEIKTITAKETTAEWKDEPRGKTDRAVLWAVEWGWCCPECEHENVHGETLFPEEVTCTSCRKTFKTEREM